MQAGVSARNFRARWGESRPRMHRRPCRPRALSVRLQARRRECGSRATLSRHAAVSMHLRGLNPSRRCLNPAEAFAGRRFRSVSLPDARIRKRRDGFRTNGRRAERMEAKDRGRSGIIGRASARNSERAIQGRPKRAQTDPCGSLAGAALEISKFGAPEPSCSESVLTSSRDSARVGRTAPFGARPEASGRRAPDGRTKKTLPSGQRKPAAGPLPCSQPQRRARRLPASGTARASCAASTDLKKPSQPDPSLGSLPGSKLEAEPQARQSMRECANG